MNEWMDCLEINQNDEERQSLIRDADLFADGVRCIMCESYIYKRDSQRINGYTVCNECVEIHGMK